MRFEVKEDGGIISSCKECIWNKTENGHQVGCHFNRIEKFKKVGVSVEEVDETGEFSQSYFKIDRFCNYARPEEWVEKYPGTIEEQENKVREDNELRWDILIVENSEESKEVAKFNLLVTLQNISLQKIVPKTINIITSNKNFPLTEIIPTTKNLMSNLKTKLLFSHGYTSNFHELVESVTYKCLGKYYFAIKSGDLIDSKFSELVEKAINEDLRWVGVVYKENDPLFYFVNLGYQKYALKNGTCIVDGIREVAKEEGTERILIEYNILCQK